MIAAIGISLVYQLNNSFGFEGASRIELLDPSVASGGLP